MLTDTRKSPYAKAVPLPFEDVCWEGGLWGEEEMVCARATVPQLKRMFDDKDISHVVENFRICAGDAEGEHDGTVFGDGDFYKWMEAAVYTAMHSGEKEKTALLSELRDYVDLIARAQQEDGYLSTKQILGEKSGNGVRRMGDINDFEVYNLGHMFTSAALYYRLTGEDTFLQVAKKAAGYLERMYEEAQKTGEVQTAVCPSHYMGLLELYRVTEDERYLRLAQKAVELRDSVRDGTDDNQDRIPLKTHRNIQGHAVRANYLYAGVADLYLETGDEEYRVVLDAVWTDLMTHKIYITGGCGALYNGASPYGNFFHHQLIHQAYGYAYQLPNITAYNETCANVGLVMWAYRMFLSRPTGEYFDVIERTMLNTNLASVSLDGMKFFYENMLERQERLEYELVWPLHRTDYITSYCCPPNLARMLAQSAEYAYAVGGERRDTVYTGLYGAGRAEIRTGNGAVFTLKQRTDYPFDGAIRFAVSDVEQDGPFVLALRIPAWAERASVSYASAGGEGDPAVCRGTWTLQAGCGGARPDGVRETFAQEESAFCFRDGYLFLKAAHAEGFRAELVLDMPVRYTVSNPMVEENRNAVAVERGPLVYCLESADSPEADPDTLRLAPRPEEFRAEEGRIAGRRILMLQGAAYCDSKADRRTDREVPLYRPFRREALKQVPVTMIPYYAWDNRGPGKMKVWIPLASGV